MLLYKNCDLRIIFILYFVFSLSLCVWSFNIFFFYILKHKCKIGMDFKWVFLSPFLGLTFLWKYHIRISLIIAWLCLFKDFTVTEFGLFLVSFAQHSLKIHVAGHIINYFIFQFFLTLILCMHVCSCMCVEVREQLVGSILSLHHMNWGIELRLSGLVASTFIFWAILFNFYSLLLLICILLCKYKSSYLLAVEYLGCSNILASCCMTFLGDQGTYIYFL